jgi:hypothetical protein
MSDDFLARENELLGGAFSLPAGAPAGNTDDIDFDRVTSAFPDIDVDGDIPSPLAPQHATSNGSGFAFSINNMTSLAAHPDVKVTGDDVIDQFESAFPDIGPSSQVSLDFSVSVLFTNNA